MPKTETILYRLAEAFEASSKNFTPENQKLADLSGGKASKAPKPRHEVLEKVWIDFKADSDVSAAISPQKKDGGLRIQVKDRGTSPWFSFSYDLSLQPLKTARFLGLLVNAKAEGVAVFRPCVRYVLPDGFEDRFSADVILVTDTPEDQISFVRVDQNLVDRATRVEVLFFFEGQNFDVTLNNVENLHI